MVLLYIDYSVVYLGFKTLLGLSGTKPVTLTPWVGWGTDLIVRPATGEYHSRYVEFLFY